MQNTKNIFFGISHRGVPTKRIRAELMSFDDLFQRVNTGAPATTTHEKYISLPSIKRNLLKATDYFLAATFSNKTRYNENVEKFHLVILDIDEHDQTKHLIDTLTKGVPTELKHLNMFFYPTTSSKEGFLKGRLVIDVEPFHNIYYKNVVRNIADIFGVKIDSSSKTLSQPMYIPLKFEDYPTEATFYPSKQHTGVVREFFEYEGNIAELATSIETNKSPDARYSDKDVLGAIKKLNVDFDDNERYEPRLRIAAAIKHQYQDDIDKGRVLLEVYANRWTTEGAKDKILHHYDTLNVEANSGLSVTIGTLIYEARKNGWAQAHDWLDDFVILRQAANPFYNTKTKEPFSKTAFDNEYGYLYLDPLVDWKKQRNDLASTFATKSRRLKSYADTMFCPGEKREFSLEKYGSEYLNTYRSIQSRHTPNHDAAQATLKIMKSHIADMVRNPRVEALIMCFLANIVQNPATPAQWALVIVGTAGTGKSIMYTWIAAILNKFAKDPRYKDYTSDQSDYLLETQFLLLNEVLEGRTNAATLTDLLKTLIEGKPLKVRVMYRNTFEVPNRLNKMLFSNKRRIITPKDDHRRYLYIDSPMTAVQAKAKYNRGGFKDAYDLANRPCDIVAALLAYKIDNKDFDLYAAYQTKDIERLREDSKGNDAQIIQGLIDSADHEGVGEHVISYSHLREAYKYDREKYVSYRVDEALEELGYRRADQRLNIPKNAEGKRVKLSIYENERSKVFQIEQAKEALKDPDKLFENLDIEAPLG